MPKHLVLRVAAGVFLGIMAAVGLYKVVDLWEMNVRAKRFAEQERVKGEKRKKAIAEAAENMLLLTPSGLEALCGTPLNTVSKSWFVAMYYFGNDGHKVEVQFSCSKGTCFFQQMRRDRTSTYDDPTPAPHEYYQTNDGNGHLAPAVNQVEELPCLAEQK